MNALLSGMIAGDTAGSYFHNGRRLEVLRHYPDRFLSLKGRELSIYLKARKTLARMQQRDIISAIEFLNHYFPDGFSTDINGVHLTLSLLRHNPRFILLSKELIFS